jgi:tetratricopeptide (TPR) repeat protein
LALALSFTPAPAATPAATPARAPARSPEFNQACARGNAKYAAHDFPAAIDAYERAVQLSPHDGYAYYLLGEGQLAAGRVTDAESTWTRASAETESDPALHARVLFVLADVSERQKKWDEAKARWVAYRTWASQFPDAHAFPATADARIQAIDRALLQDKAYEVVRQRIAETQDGGVFNEVSKPAPPAK